MSETPFRLEPSPAVPLVRAPDTFFLVTNHLNLMYMLASGLIMPPAGFSGKHYRDPLATFPGWIPLFVKSVPAAAIQLCTEEARHLRPVIVELKLRRLAGTIRATGRGVLRRFQFPEQFSGWESALLVPAPLPVSSITSIIFPSNEDRSAFKQDAADFSNVAVRNLRLEIRRKGLFSKASPEQWPPARGPTVREAPLSAAQAAGGIMAMLQQVANRGELAVRACRQAFDTVAPPAELAGDPVLAGLSVWMRTGRVSLPAGADLLATSDSFNGALGARVFWGAVESLADSRRDTRQEAAEDVLLESLHRTAEKIESGPPLRERMRRLRKTLVSLTGLGSGSASEAIGRHQSPTERAMILFFLRRTCAELLEFSTEQLSVADWLAAAILFGARAGWLGLPTRLRQPPELSASISHRMAQMAHRLEDTDLELGEPPPRVWPLRELLDPASQWTPDSRRHVAAMVLARSMNWDCIGTRLSFPRDECELTDGRDWVNVNLPGTFKVLKSSVGLQLSMRTKVVPIVDRSRFFEFLAGTRLDPRKEVRARQAFEQCSPAEAT